MGSVTALACALESINTEVICLCDSDIPERLSFICADRYQKDCEPRGDELIVSVDVASPSMLGALCEKFAPITDIRIDHHGKGTDFGKYSYVESEASAAGEIIFRLLSYMQLLRGNEIVSALYAAISSDTGCFRYSNTTAQTHMIGAYLLSMGAPAAEINEALYDTVSFASLEVYPLFLQNCISLFDGRVNLVTVTNEIKRRHGISDSDLEDLSNLARRTGGAQLGIVLRQKDGRDTEFKISMRSRKQINCSEIAAYFGGGGHLRAAGATLQADSPEKAQGLVIEALEKFIR